jgi:hypothetical protein
MLAAGQAELIRLRWDAIGKDFYTLKQIIFSVLNCEI